jgi:hypothetical protein
MARSHWGATDRDGLSIANEHVDFIPRVAALYGNPMHAGIVDFYRGRPENEKP